MKVFDCFTFYNELDLLEIRLEELADQVDYFVIVEATRTFQNQPKLLYYRDNQSRYAKYQDKIIHVQVNDMPEHSDPWQNERFQREAIKRGLGNADSNDIVIIGDVDEILRAEVVDRLRQSRATLMPFRLPYFNFYFNYLMVNNEETYCIWNIAAKWGSVTSIEDLRLLRLQLNRLNLPFNYKDHSLEIIEHAGWHFSYMGNKDFIVNKLKSFAHAELNRPSIFDAIDIDKMIQNGRGFNPLDDKPFVSVELDDYFSSTVRNSKWSQYQMYSTTKITDFLPWN